jgi:hypothetical protein
MAWFYYNGKVSVPIPVKKGLSISVRGGTKFEVLESTQELETLMQRGLVKQTTPDKKAKPVESMSIPVLSIGEVMNPSKMVNMFNGIVDNGEQEKKEAAVITPKVVEKIEAVVETVIEENVNAFVGKEVEKEEDGTKEIEDASPLGEDENGGRVKRRRKSGSTSTEI